MILQTIFIVPLAYASLYCGGNPELVRYPLIPVGRDEPWTTDWNHHWNNKDCSPRALLAVPPVDQTESNPKDSSPLLQQKSVSNTTMPVTSTVAIQSKPLTPKRALNTHPTTSQPFLPGPRGQNWGAILPKSRPPSSSTRHPTGPTAQ